MPSRGRARQGKTAARHTSAEFVAFLTDIVLNHPTTQKMHVIADSLSSPRATQVTEFLGCHPVTLDLGEPQLDLVEPGRSKSV
jgi:hypothetical protein